LELRRPHLCKEHEVTDSRGGLAASLVRLMIPPNRGILTRVAILECFRFCAAPSPFVGTFRPFHQPRRRRDISLRWTYLHMIGEHARHNRHADLIRERIDGAVGE